MNKNDIVARLSNNNSTILSFPDRGNTWGNSEYRGNCSGWIQAFCIWKYRVQKLAELFAGSGTGSDVARDMGIDYIGADLNPIPVRPNILTCNAIADEVPDGFRDADFLFMHPPYSSLININWAGKAWEDPTGELAKYDLGNMGWEDFIRTLNEVILKYFSAMKGGSRMGILMGDVKRNGVLYSMLTDIVRPGQMEQIIIKAQHNCWSDGRKYANANFVPIVHEYLLILKKVEEFFLSYYLPHKFERDIRDIEGASWKDVVLATIRKLRSSDLPTLYKMLEGHKKAQNNPNYKATIRKVLQELRDKGLVRIPSVGFWCAA